MGTSTGTTQEGGTYGYGTVFKVTARGTITTLNSFCAQSNCPDGAIPAAGLVQGRDSDFYRTTTGGGANGDGTVFKITAAGMFTSLHSFAGFA